MARKNVDPVEQVEQVEQKEVLFKFRRKYGKHHLRTPKGVVIIKPGDILEASEGSYVGNQWECLGPVDGTEQVAAPELPPAFEGFTKEQRKDGFFVINPKTNEAVNTEPLTEEQADALVSASTEHP